MRILWVDYINKWKDTASVPLTIESIRKLHTEFPHILPFIHRYKDGDYLMFNEDIHPAYLLLNILIISKREPTESQLETYQSLFGKVKTYKEFLSNQARTEQSVELMIQKYSLNQNFYNVHQYYFLTDSQQIEVFTYDTYYDPIKHLYFVHKRLSTEAVNNLDKLVEHIQGTEYTYPEFVDYSVKNMARKIIP